MKADINAQLTLQQYIMTKEHKLLLHSMTEMVTSQTVIIVPYFQSFRMTEIFSRFAKCLGETVISRNA